jgi:hypothetical protein
MFTSRGRKVAGVFDCSDDGVVIAGGGTIREGDAALFPKDLFDVVLGAELHHWPAVGVVQRGEVLSGRIEYPTYKHTGMRKAQGTYNKAQGTAILIHVT